MIKILISSILYSLLLIGLTKADFEYEGDSQSKWVLINKACGGSRQSPINIERSKAVYDKSLKDFNFENYDLNLKWKIKYNGHSVKLTPPENSPPIKVSGSNFPRPLNLINLHFHWGVKKGSEHTIDGKSYGLELHIVNKNKFGDVAVLGFFFEETKIDNPELNHLLEVAISLDQQTQSPQKIKLRLTDILPDLNSLNLGGYYRYAGSLTTPPCSEVVVWTLFENKINISSEQLNSFNEIFRTPTTRDVQSLNSRTVYKSRP